MGMGFGALGTPYHRLPKASVLAMLQCPFPSPHNSFKNTFPKLGLPWQIPRREDLPEAPTEAPGSGTVKVMPQGPDMAEIVEMAAALYSTSMHVP